MSRGFEINKRALDEMMKTLQGEFDKRPLKVAVRAESRPRRPGGATPGSRGAGPDVVYNAPVFYGDANGAQLAWNIDGVVNQSQLERVAPGFEAIADAITELLEGLSNAGLNDEDATTVAEVSEVLLDEVTSQQPDSSKVRHLVLVLKGALAPIAIAASQAAGRDGESCAKTAIEHLTRAVGVG